MNKIISGAVAAALLGFTALAGISPTAAYPVHSNFQQQDRYIGDYCDQNRFSWQCRDWRANRSRWSDNEYRSFYRIHRADPRFRGNAVAGLFGFAMAAALNGTLRSDHVRACEARYHSYNRNTDRFFGYDGSFHVCRL